jgi:hypothetical protein
MCSHRQFVHAGRWHDEHHLQIQHALGTSDLGFETFTPKSYENAANFAPADIRPQFAAINLASCRLDN